MVMTFARRLVTASAAGLGAYILLFRPWQHRWGATDEEIKRTRLISRLRGQDPQNQPLAARLAGYFFEPVEFLMTRKMLLGIKQRAEQASTLSAIQDSQEKPLKNGKAAVPSRRS